MSNLPDMSDFERRAQAAEKLAQTNPSLYKLKLLCYALLGYGVIFALLFALFGLIGGMIGMAVYSTALLLLLVKKKLILFIIPAIWILFKSLWVKVEAPNGYVLTRKKAPRLFDELDRLRTELKAPKIHQVILTPELNAAISQTPRLGVLGWQKNTLIIGLELLLILSPEQARAVLAHEFGHLSGNHSRFNGWIYRVRMTWHRIMYAFQNDDGFGAKLMRKFFDWYTPRFSAYSFALARSNEYEADQISAQLTSPQAASKALINTHVTGPYVDENYWQFFFKKADRMAEPDHGPWQGLSHFLGEHVASRDELQKKMEQELTNETGMEDTHPALKDRIGALSATAAVPEPVDQTAAEIWLADEYQGIIRDFDTDWIAEHGERWKERHEYVVESQAKLTELNKLNKDELSDEQLWEKASLVEEFVDKEEAFDLFTQFQVRYPDDPNVAFVLGRLLYDKNDEALLDQMKIALNQPNLVHSACEYAYYFLIKAERIEDANWWLTKSEEQSHIDEISEKERSQLTLKCKLVKAEIDETMKQHIIKTLSANKNVKKVWIAQKPMQYYAHVPAYGIAIEFKQRFGSVDKLVQEVLEQLDLDCSYFVVPKSGDFKKLAKKIIKLKDRLV